MNNSLSLGVIKSEREKGTTKTEGQRNRANIHTHLSLADATTLFADNAVDSGPVVQSVNQRTTTGVHKRVLQRTEQNSVQLLYIVLIGSLRENMRKKH